MRKRTRRVSRLLAAERGASIVEYTAVSAIALIVAGLIVAGLSGGRFRIGAAMAAIHDRQIGAFGHGAGGTADLDASLYPRPRPPQIDAPFFPALSIPALLLPLRQERQPPMPPAAPAPAAPAPAAPVPPALAIPQAPAVAIPALGLPGLLAGISAP